MALRQRAAATQTYVPQGDTPAARAEDAAAQWLKARASDARRRHDPRRAAGRLPDRPRETVRYIPTACVSSVPARPDMPTERLSSADALDKIMQAALAEIDVRRAYRLDMRAALVGCVKVTRLGTPRLPTLPKPELRFPK